MRSLLKILGLLLLAGFVASLGDKSTTTPTTVYAEPVNKEAEAITYLGVYSAKCGDLTNAAYAVMEAKRLELGEVAIHRAIDKHLENLNAIGKSKWCAVVRENFRELVR